MFFYQLVAKLVGLFSLHILHRAGSTWPGEIVFKLKPNILKQLRPFFKQIIIITGTNGKTSTTQFLAQVFQQNQDAIISNHSGANLGNGVLSSLLIKLPFFPKKQHYVAVLEMDEYAFAEVGTDLKPNAVIILNLFRDQLDRFGEVGNVLQNYQQVFSKLAGTLMILPSADPGLQSLLLKLKNPNLTYLVPNLFLNPKTKVVGDYAYCPVCQSKLTYQAFYLGHLGKWQCLKCGFKPQAKSFVFNSQQLKKLSNLPDFLQINLSAVYLLVKHLKLKETFFWQVVNNWQPSFGRGEVIKTGFGKTTVYLGKNPASWSAVLNNLQAKDLTKIELIMGLNNRVPDGHDISWIYDACFKLAQKPKSLIVFGDRAYDLVVRLKLENQVVNQAFTDLKALENYLKSQEPKKRIILANYSAMLGIRQLLTGRSLN